MRHIRTKSGYMLLLIASLLMVTVVATTSTANVLLNYQLDSYVGTNSGVTLQNGTIGIPTYNSEHTAANVTLSPSVYWVMSADSHGDLATALWNGSTYLLYPNGTVWHYLGNSLVSLHLTGSIAGIALSYASNLILELMGNGTVIYSSYNNIWHFALSLPTSNYTSLAYTTDASKNSTATPYFFAMNSSGYVYSISPSKVTSWSLYVSGISTANDFVSLASNSGGNLFALESNGKVYSSWSHLPWVYDGTTGRANERSIVYAPYSKGKELFVMNLYPKPAVQSLTGGNRFFIASPALPAGIWVAMVNNYYLDNRVYLIAINNLGYLYVAPYSHFVAICSDANSDLVAVTNTGDTYILNQGASAWSYLGNSIVSTGNSIATAGQIAGIAASYYSIGLIAEITDRGYVFTSPYSTAWTLAASQIGGANGNFTSMTYTVGWSNNISAAVNPYFFAMENNGTVYASSDGARWSIYIGSTNGTDMKSLASNSGGDILAINSSGSIYRSYSNQQSTGIPTPWQYVGNAGMSDLVSVSYLYGSHDSVYNLLPSTGGVKGMITTNGGISSQQFGNALPAGSYVAIVNSTSIYSGYGTAHHLAALEPNGTIYVYSHCRWSFLTGGTVRSSPALWNNTVYFGSGDDTLYAVNATTGVMNWNYATGAAIVDRPLIYSNNLYFGSNNFYALNASTGQLVWAYPSPGGPPPPPPPPPPPIANTVSTPSQYNGIVYFADTNDVVYAINATTGGLVWYYNAGAGSFTTSTTLSFLLVKGVLTAVLYIGSSNNNVYAINALTGALIWRYNAGSAITSDVMVYNNVAFVGANNGRLYAINAATGKLISRYNLGGAIYSSPEEFGDNIFTGSNLPEFYSLSYNAGAFTTNWGFIPGGNIYSTSFPTHTDVYVGTSDNDLYALNRSYGYVNWSFTALGPVRSSPLYSNGWIYVGSDDFNLYALNTYAVWEKRATVPGLPPPSGSPPTALLWKYTTGKSILRSSPREAYGNIYFGSSDDKVYALNATAGTFVWSYTTGKVIYSTPAINNGVVYIGSNDNHIYALNATAGTLLWSDNLGPGSAVESSPAVAYGMVFFGAANNQIYGLNAKTGATVWRYNTGSPVYASPLVCNGIVYIGSNSHYLYALNATAGTLLWRYNARANIYTTPAYSGGVLYLSTNRNGGTVAALNATSGSSIWEQDINPAGAGGNQYSSPVIYQNNIYIGSQDSNLYVINATTGSIEWTFGTGNAVDSTPMIYGDNVYFGSTDSSLYAVNISRENIVWSFKTGSSIDDSPAEYINIIYAGSTDSNMYAIKSGFLPNAPALDNSDYGNFLDVYDGTAYPYSISLILLSASNLNAVQYLAISINGTSQQIVIQAGTIIASSGNSYTLASHTYDTLYITDLLSPGTVSLNFLVTAVSGGVIIEEFVTLYIK